MLKTWRLRNDGNCAWGPGQYVHSLAFFNGTPMGAPSEVALPTYTAPGGVVDVSVNLIAPQQEGTYRSEWMLMVAQGPLFGVGPYYQTPLYAQIQVQRGIPDGYPCYYAATFPGRCVRAGQQPHRAECAVYQDLAVAQRRQLRVGTGLCAAFTGLPGRESNERAAGDGTAAGGAAG